MHNNNYQVSIQQGVLMQLSQQSLESPPSPTRDLINNSFPHENHPYRTLEREINDLARSDDVVLEIVSGNSPYSSQELEGFIGTVHGIGAANMATVTNASIDIAFSRGLIHHVGSIDCYYSTLFRILRPSGVYVFLTPNYWGFEQIMSRVIPKHLKYRLMDPTW